MNETPIIIAKPGQFAGKVDVIGPARDQLAVIEAASYLLKEMDKQRIGSLSLMLDSAGNPEQKGIVKEGHIEIDCIDFGELII